MFTGEIVFLRHGQSTANAAGVWQGQLDFPLSEFGREQARQAGRALAGSPVAGVYTSPLLRASQTAEGIARELSATGGYENGIVALPGLMERSGGMFEGRVWAEFQQENPDLMEKFMSLPEAEAWRLAGAEDDAQVLVRFEAAVSEIQARHAGSGGSLLVVSHGGALRAYLRHLFGEEVLTGTRRAPNASLTRVSWSTTGSSEGHPRLVDLALTGHLEG